MGEQLLGEKITKLYFSTYRSILFLAILSIAGQTCLSSFKLYCSKCSLMTSTQLSMHPSESSLNSFGFWKVFLDLPPPRSLESVFLVANASNVLFIISHVLNHVMASGPTLLLVVESPGPFVVFEVPLFMIVLPPPPLLLCSLHPGVMVTVLTTACSVVVPQNRLFFLAFDLLPACLVMQSFSRWHPVWIVWHMNSQSGLCSLCLFSSPDSLTYCSQCHTVVSFLACLF